MTGAAQEIAGVRMFVCAADGPPLNAERDAGELLNAAFGFGARVIAIPTARLGPDFLHLRTRVAGEVLQKFITYGFRVAIVGDISAATAQSEALRDFVRESNRGVMVRFAADLVALGQSLPEAWRSL